MHLYMGVVERMVANFGSLASTNFIFENQCCPLTNLARRSIAIHRALLNADTGNPVQYPQRTQVIDGKSVTTYFPIRESFIQHIRSHMTDQEHAFVMRAAERHFANL